MKGPEILFVITSVVPREFICSLLGRIRGAEYLYRDSTVFHVAVVALTFR